MRGRQRGAPPDVHIPREEYAEIRRLAQPPEEILRVEAEQQVVRGGRRRGGGGGGRGGGRVGREIIHQQGVVAYRARPMKLINRYSTFNLLEEINYA